MTAKEKTIWEQAVRVLRRNTVTAEPSGREKRVLVTARKRGAWQRRTAS
jgi:hypothetical protein